jgi:hypothetical protein
MFRVTIIDPAHADGKPIKLITPRTGADVEKLRAKYARVDAEPIVKGFEARPDAPGPQGWQDAPEPPPTRREGPAPQADDFQIALHALIHLYGTARKRGDVGLARRTEDAVAALLGEQKHLKGDDDKPIGVRMGNGVAEPKNVTLTGIGRMGR